MRGETSSEGRREKETVREEGETMRRGWREVKESQMRKCGRDRVKGERQRERREERETGRREKRDRCRGRRE